MAFGGKMRGIIFSYILMIFGLIFISISEWLDSGNVKEKKMFADYCFATKLGFYIMLIAVLIVIPSIFYFLAVDFKTMEFYFLIAHICPRNIWESRTIIFILTSLIVLPPTISLIWNVAKVKWVNKPTKIPLRFIFYIIVDLLLTYMMVLVMLFS